MINFYSWIINNPWEAIGKGVVVCAIASSFFDSIGTRTGWKWATITGGVLGDLGANLVSAICRFKKP